MGRQVPENFEGRENAADDTMLRYISLYIGQNS